MIARGLASALVLAGCAPALDALDEPSDPVLAAEAYVNDAHARRRALEASVAVADTSYGRLRLAHYGIGWESLPEYAPRVRRLRVTGARGDAELEEGEVLRAPIDRGSLESWERAGADAFHRYPAQIDLRLEVLREAREAERGGLRVDDEGVVEGAVEVETEAGWIVALTCAACHSAERDARVIAGLSSDEIDLGYLFGADWPRGTMDVTNDDVANPVRPSDLRAIAHQARLHHAGNVANGRIARMVRIETLLITQRDARARPSRDVVAALALYLESLSRALPPLATGGEGARLFAEHCARCHQGDALAGPPVAVEIVGTDAAATARGTERSTLGYRAPSLRGAADRRGVLHDGSASDLRALLQLAPSAHRGHAFGLDASASEREAIATFLAGE